MTTLEPYNKIEIEMNITNNTDFEYDYKDREYKLLFEFLIKGVFLGIVCILGIFGNIITMIILSRPQMRSSINCILIGLARCDTALLITALLIFSLPSLHSYTGYLFTYFNQIFPIMAPILFPIGLIAQTGSVYLTLTVTLERYVAVCHPLKARSLCTYGRARIYVICIIIFAILYNLPRFFEVERAKFLSKETNTTTYRIIPSTLRSNPYYITIYVNWAYLVVMYFIPFSCLAVFNTAIYKQVRKANAERQRLSRLQKKEIGLATMLMCVVIVFFMCNILALVNNILEAFYDGLMLDELVATSNLLVAINSSVNVIIYVIFGEKFKRLFLKLFCQYTPFGYYTHQQGPQVTKSTACCGAGASGRDSPEQTQNDDSYITIGNGHTYSMKQMQGSCRHHRSSSNSFDPDAKNRLKTPTTNNSVKIQLLPMNNIPSRSSLRSPSIACVHHLGNNSNCILEETEFNADKSDKTPYQKDSFM